MIVTHKLIVIGFLFLVTLATGFWRGYAANPALSGTLHKLLGLAWVVYSVIVLYHSARPIQSRTAFYAAIAVLVVSMIALIATGSVLTLPKTETTAWLTLHRVASAIAVIASAILARILFLNRA
jgi:asparagine N-glycosylation enzyme membrane subunit Stt3